MNEKFQKIQKESERLLMNPLGSHPGLTAGGAGPSHPTPDYLPELL
jgi:hypothetical protein